MKSKHTSCGFTLVETLVAVTILGLVSVGALRLVIMSQRTLEEVRIQRLLLDEARQLQVLQRAGTLPDRGESGDLVWEIRQRQEKIEEFGVDIPFKEMEVTFKGRSISLFFP